MKLNYKRTILIGFAFLSISAFWQMYDNIIPLILSNTFHLGETMTGAIMAADNVLAVILLPLLGSWSDRTDTRFGRRMPFIVVGTLLAVSFMMLIPLADRGENLPLFMISLGAVLVSMGLYRSPAVALMPDLTPKPLRSQGNAIINLMGAVGGVYSLILISRLVKEGERPDYFPLFAGVAFVMVLALVILVCTIREKKLAAEVAQIEEKEEKTEKTEGIPAASAKLPKEVRKSLIFILASIFFWFAAYNAVTTAFSRYVRVVWGLEGGGFANCLMVATVAAILSYIPIGQVAARIGRKKSIQIGLVMMFVCYLCAALLPTYSPILNLFFALIGMGWAAISVNSLPMVVEMCAAADVGRYTGLYYTFSMTAQIFTPVLSGYLLQHVSYRTLFPYACAFTLLAMGTMTQVRHGDSKPKKKEKVLENFDVDDD